MCENLPASAEFSGEELISGALLLFTPNNMVPRDQIAVDVNGQEISAENIEIQWRDEEGKPPLCSFSLTSPPAVYGDNYLGLKLITTATEASDDVTVDEVEVIVKVEN